MTSKMWGEVYMLQLFASWNYTAHSACDAAGLPYSTVIDAVLFDVQTDDEAEVYASENRINPAMPADIPLALACPQVDRVLQFAYNATATSAGRLNLQTSQAQADPCVVKVDQAVASSISSSVASMVSSMQAASMSTTTAHPTSTSSGGVGVVRPVQTALAAACVLCGLTFS
jgi:hypothetical protein